MMRFTHVVVTGPLGRREIVPVESYAAAPASFVEATHARLVPLGVARRMMIMRLMAGRR
jgi:hypothetical protein